MLNKLLLAAAFAVAPAAPALAQDASDQPVHAGPRVEATVGWDDIVLHTDGTRGSKSGVTYGGEIGYDVRLGTGALLGAYAGIDGASTRECLVDGTETSCIRAGRNITVGARIGAHVGSRTLIYGKGGYSNGRITATYTDTAFPSDNERGSGNFDGFHVGAGVEVGLSRGFYGKAEYTYTNYSVGEDEVDSDLDRHRIVAGFGYRF